MMKKISTIVATTMALCFAWSGVGCMRGNGDLLNDKINENMTQLWLGVYDGGLGLQWARNIGNAFQEKYAETSFEEGKMGVQVNIDPQKSNFEPNILVPNLQGGATTDDIYFTASMDYEYYVQNGVAEDATAIWTEKVYDVNGELVGSGGTKSMLDKVDPWFVDAFKYNDGKYYGFPYEDSLKGFVYDADLFEEKGYQVPETMDEFYDLIDNMVKDGITPFTWTGANDFYFTTMTTGIVVQYGGIDAANQNLFHNGTYDGVEITSENAYLLAGQQGKLEALKFLRQITSNSQYYSADAFKPSQSHLIAQSEFLSSVEAAKQDVSKRRIAMLYEGEWWENEARATFDEMNMLDENYGYGKRNFKFMKLPKIDGQQMTQSVMPSFSSGSYAFINKKAKQKEVAKLFIQFMHSESQLETFTTTNGAVLPYDYDLSEAQYNSLTPFAKSVWDLKHDDDVYVWRTKKACDAAKYMDIELGGISNSEIVSICNGQTYLNALRAFSTSSVTAEEYFAGHKAYLSKDKWTTEYNRYLATKG